MVKKYQQLHWDAVPSSRRQEIANIFDYTPRGFKDYKTKITVSCKVCRLAMYKGVTYDWWRLRHTVKEQRHLDSERHHQNLLLQKLGCE